MRYTGVEEEAEDPAMRSVLGIAVCLGLGLTRGAGKPRIAFADAIGDLNGDGRRDLVTHYNEDENDTCSESDGVEVCTAYAYVSLGKRNGTFGQRRLVYTNDYADVAAAAVGDV